MAPPLAVPRVRASDHTRPRRRMAILGAMGSLALSCGIDLSEGPDSFPRPIVVDAGGGGPPRSSGTSTGDTAGPGMATGGGTGQPSGTGGVTGTGGMARTGGTGGTTGTGGAGGTSAPRGGTGGTAPSTGGMMGTGGTAGAPPSGGTTGTTPPPPIQSGCNGYATRFWDCCKPHCGWSANASGASKPVPSCGKSNEPVGNDTQSACNNGGAYMCYGLTPWAASPTLAYGFAATSTGNICGRCYQLQFTGNSHNAGNDPGSRALAGKTMIVQAINVGYDVGGGQFDIAIPGGGVGTFNACASQWGVSNSELGAQYGGFLTTCKQQVGASNHDALKTCVSQRCTSVFQGRGLNDLAAGCRFFVDWFQVADNPALKYKEIRCPSEIVNRSGVNRNDVGTQCGN